MRDFSRYDAPYEFKDLPPAKYKVGDYTNRGRIDGVNGCTYLNTDPKYRYVVKHSPFDPRFLVPSHICCSEDQLTLVYPIAQLEKFKEAVLWHYNQRGHDRCHLTDNEMYKMCGLLPRDKSDLPPEEEFAARCKEYKEGLYKNPCKTEKKYTDPDHQVSYMPSDRGFK